MAANFWESTQRKHWIFTKDELAAMRQSLEDADPALVQMYPLPEPRHLNIYFNQQILRLGKRLGVRQQAIATAQMYVKRFYTKIEIRRTNPFLLLATAVYLACKMEETPQHIRLVGQEARSLWPSDIGLNNPGESTAKMGECEFFLISEMSSHLIIHQPYRTLTSLQDTFNLHPEEVSLAWSLINDHYMTDLPLLYPPHVIALTAMLLAIILRPANTPSQTSQQQQQQHNDLGSAAGRLAHTPSNLAAAQASFAQLRAANQGTGNVVGAPTPTLTPQSSGGLSGLVDGGGSENNGKKGPDPRWGRVQRIIVWLADSNIDIEAMVDCAQELISFYEVQEDFDERSTRDSIIRFIKARGL
ncbi:RNA polymerase II holoenzyme cyclin-like subunit [Naviculisporaceae sp. PSN 640]